MADFCLHPAVYQSGSYKSLLNILEHIWMRDQPIGQGTFYIISGFANYNGGVRFFEGFRQHIKKGGKVVAIFSGSTAQKLTSKQVVKELVDLGAEVHIINRKRLLHAKCYGSKNADLQSLVVTSGNFTAPGLNQNAEASILLNSTEVKGMGFSWEILLDSIFQQKWDIYSLSKDGQKSPGWKLLYDERQMAVTLEEDQERTMILTLGHNDTARIQASAGTEASKGTQYFWLSRDCYDFFPPLTIRNARGLKATYSALISMNYVNLNVIDPKCRVTFEAENNLDFRLGTGKLRATKLAKKGDLAAITRVGEDKYELRIFRKGTPQFNSLSEYAISFIGHQNKQYGYINNMEFFEIIKKPAGNGKNS